MSIVIVIAVCVFVIILLAVSFYYGNTVFSVVLDAKAPKTRAFEYTKKSPSEQSQDEAAFEQARKIDNEWFDAHAKDVSIHNRSGLLLCGKYLPNGSPDRTVICMHGYRGNVYQMASVAHWFTDKGWNVLVPHQRGHALSEGAYHGIGYLEHFDLLDWSQWVLGSKPNTRILFYGISMGAATVMMASSEADPRVKAFIADCGFSSIVEELARPFQKVIPRPFVFTIMAAGSLITKLRAGFFWQQGNCRKYVKKSTIPKLFIHGTADTFVPLSMMEEVYNAASVPKEKLVVPGGEHAKAQYQQPELYWNTVDSFLKRWMEV
jgi:fermentation-respiration switch protein FrsA (DUF1100 family)